MVPCKTSLARLAWLENCPVRKAFSLGAFVKSNQWQFNIMAAWGETNLKGKVQEWDVHKGLWKALTHFWESRRPCTYAGLRSCTRNTWEGPNLSPLADMRFSTNRMYRLDQSCKQTGWVLKSFPKTHRPSAKTRRLIGSGHLRKSPIIRRPLSYPNSDFTGHTKQRVQILFIKITKQTNRKKQQQQQQLTLETWEILISRVATLYYLKCLLFKKNLQDMQISRKVWAIRRGRKKALNRNYPWRTPVVGHLTDKHFSQLF